MHVAVGRAAVQSLLQAAFLSTAFFFVAFGGQHAHAGKKACPVPAQVSIADQQVEDQLNFQKEFMVQIDKVKARAAAVKAKVFGITSTGAAQAREVTKDGAGNVKATAKAAASKAKEGAKEAAAVVQEKAAGVNSEDLKRPEVFVPVSAFILVLIYLLWRGSGAATKVAATTAPGSGTSAPKPSAPKKAAPAPITPGTFVEAQSTRTNLTPAPTAATSVSALAAAIAKGEQEAKVRMENARRQAELEAAAAIGRAERDAVAAQQRVEKEGEVERSRIAWEVAGLQAQQLKLQADAARAEALARARVERAMAAAAKAEKEAAEAKVKSDRRAAAAAAAKAERDQFLAATAKAKAEREAAETKARADKVAAVAAARPPRAEGADEPAGRQSSSLTGANDLPGVRNSVSLAGEAGFSAFTADEVRVGRSGSTTFASGVRKYRAAVFTPAERERMAKMVLGISTSDAEGAKNITQFIANDLSAAIGQLFKNAVTPRK